MTFDLRFKPTSRLLLPAAGAVLVAVGIAQNRVVALGAHQPQAAQISALSGQPENGMKLRNPRRYGTPALATTGLRFGKVGNFFAPVAAQLPDVIVCEANVTEGGWGRSDPTASFPVSVGKVTFGGSASITRNNARGGQETYSDHNGVDAFTFHSFVIIDVICSDDGGQAVIAGQGRVTKLATSEDLQVNFEIELQDNAEPGMGQDKYRIRLTGLYTTPFVYDSGLITLQGGNVQIRRSAP
jgi:hypothetical protein